MTAGLPVAMFLVAWRPLPLSLVQPISCSPFNPVTENVSGGEYAVTYKEP